MDVEFDDSLVHFERLGKADGSALQSLEMGAEVEVLAEVLALDTLRAVFAHAVALNGQDFSVALPIVGGEVAHITVG